MAGFDKMMVMLLDAGDRVIFEKKLTALPLREEVVIAKSIEFFDDPEPCMIHRSAVMKRLFVEIADYFEGLPVSDGRRLDWNELPDFIKSYLQTGGNVRTVVIKQK